ncbi:TIGR01777 family oxidoreductase [Puniceicoccaceae bacterium K14]|nr:TIGR01777 family oxidoreductase [Puniceicoccaceae bacterium K14]
MKIEQKSLIEASAEDLYRWHARKLTFQRLLPPWEKVEVLEMGEGLDTGRRVVLKVSTPLGSKEWVGEHTAHSENEFFEDTQTAGPFKKWNHRHTFEAGGEEQSRLIDSIEFELPLGILGRVFGERFVRKKLERGFAYRHKIARNDLKLYLKFKDEPRLHILIAGGSGFIGRALHCLLETQGHTVSILTRRPTLDTDIGWDPENGSIGLKKESRFDVVINLAGENLFSKRWTERNKKAFWSSRVDTTRFLVDSLKSLNTPPNVFIAGSAIGIYGNRGDERLTEDSGIGKGFLADLCSAWENEACRAEEFIERVALLRTGIVLDPRGGALALMHRPFRLGVGGPLGDGQQWFPWIALDDWLYATYKIIMTRSARGPFNLVSNGCSRNGSFSKDLAKSLKRPCLFRVPEFALRSLFGEMAEETLLSSSRAVPHRLEAELGFQFRYSRARDAFSSLL